LLEHDKPEGDDILDRITDMFDWIFQAYHLIELLLIK
jgi:hypothetical protein